MGSRHTGLGLRKEVWDIAVGPFGLQSLGEEESFQKRDYTFKGRWPGTEP